MDCIIVYERKQRELENAILLKIELENRGYTCKIVQYYEASKFNIFSKKVMLVPHLYGRSSIYRNFSRFGKADFLVNLQYEQVLSDKWEKLGHHNPKDEAVNAYHICWGTTTKERLINAGVPQNNLKVIAPIHFDLLRKEFRRDSKKLKSDLAKECNIDSNKRWNLFISSFTYADLDNNRLKMNENVAGVSLAEFPIIHTNSRDEILNWFRKILNEDKESLLIYRPHPDELKFEKVLELEKEFNNFKFIRFSSVKDWIEASDNIYSWYSTSVVESHFLNKPYAILRPRVLPDDFDSVLIKKAKFITNYEDFRNDYFRDDSLRDCAISNDDIRKYYEINDEIPSFKLYVDFIEELFISNKKQNYKISFKEKLQAYVTTLKVIVVFSLYKVFKEKVHKYKTNNKRNILQDWFIEMDNQIVSNNELVEIENNLKKIVVK